VYYYGDGNTHAGLNLSVGDLDGDGIAELIVGQKNNGLVMDVDESPSFLLLEAPYGDGRLEEAAAARFLELSESQNGENRRVHRGDAFVGDLDGDGTEDIALLGNKDGDEETYAWHLFSGPLSGSYTSSNATVRATDSSATISPCDLNEDARPDLCTSSGVFLGPLSDDLNADDADWDWGDDNHAPGLYSLEGSDWWGDGSTGLAALLVWYDNPQPRIAILEDDLSPGQVSWPTWWELEDIDVYDILGGHDLTGDGSEDLVITGNIWEGQWSRRAAILSQPREGSGDNGSIHTWFPSDMISGAEMAAAGDFDGDGHADLALATSRGWVNIFRGPIAAGELAEEDADIILCGPDEPTCTSAESCNDADHFGYQIAVGDMDGDGIDDLVVSAPWADDGAADTGRIYIIPSAGL